METRELTNQGMGVAIGDGQQTEFWNHRWLDGKILREHVIGPIPEAHSLNWVCDYSIQRTGWDWGQLSYVLPLEILQLIASFELVNQEVGDKLMWIASKTGRFTIKSAIRILKRWSPWVKESGSGFSELGCLIEYKYFYGFFSTEGL